MVKLPLFLFILVTVEELLPLMVIYTPFLLPSTCILPSQKQKIRDSVEVKRMRSIERLRDLLAHTDLKNAATLTETIAHLPKPLLHELLVCVGVCATHPAFIICRRGVRRH